MDYVTDMDPVPQGSSSGNVDFISTERVGYVYEGLAKSRSDPDETYQPRFLLQVDAWCTCPAGLMRDAYCAHLEALLEKLDADGLREWIKEAQSPREDGP